MMMESSDVESGIDQDTEANRNATSEMTIRCDTPAPPEFGVEKEVRSSRGSRKFDEVKEVNENQKPPSALTVTPLSQLRSVNGPIPTNPREMRFYPGDIVVRRDKIVYNMKSWVPVFGTILKPGVGTEMAMNPDRGSSNEFHVHWDTNNRILLTKAAEVGLVDRVLLRGQRIENFQGRVGTVVDYEITATCQLNGTNEVMANVPLKRLQPISPYVRGLEIMYKGWVGVIASIRRNVWFRFDGGLTFYIETVESDGFTKTDPFWGLGVACPGMRTRLPPSTFKKAQWIQRTWKFINRWLPLHYLYSYAFATVIRTEVTQLEVRWLQQTPATLNPDSYASAPPQTNLRGAELSKVLIVGTPSFETIGINSVRKIMVTPEDRVVDHEVWLEDFKKKFVDEKEPGYRQTKKPTANVHLKSLLQGSGDELTPVKVLLRHNMVTVKWEDGSLEKIPAIKLPRISPTADDGEFPMGLTVAPVQKDSSNGDKYGIVMESNELARARTRKVNILWIVDGKDSGIQETSVFDIRPHHMYSMYHRGTIVFPRKSTLTTFPSAVVVDVNLCNGKMVVVRANDVKQEEVFPHQVVALGKRCHWSFFTRTWVIDDLVVPPYQLDLEFDPCKKLVDVNEQDLQVLANEDVNNPGDAQSFPTLWDEPAFELLGFAPESHRYYKSSSGDIFAKEFARHVKAEIEFLQEPGNVPEGVWIRCYENRLDLVSVLMVGPTKTPYDDGLFLFDIQLSWDYPKTRPAIHYVSYTLEVHPLLSFDGNVCGSFISWEFPNTPDNPNPQSYLAHFLSKLQTLIFTPDPYFSHPAKKIEENTERGRIKTRMYNQGVFVRVMDSAWNMLQRPHAPWEKCIRNHFASAMPEKFHNIEKWLNEENPGDCPEEDYPSYPLLPVPDGLRSAIRSRMDMFKKLSNGVTIVEVNSVMDTTADSESYEVQHAQQEEMKQNPVPISSRLLTPIAEITETSSTSTFGAKLSNLSVPTEELQFSQSLDSMENVKPSSKSKNKFNPESESEQEELELNIHQSPNNAPAASME